MWGKEHDGTESFAGKMTAAVCCSGEVIGNDA